MRPKQKQKRPAFYTDSRGVPKRIGPLLFSTFVVTPIVIIAFVAMVWLIIGNHEWPEAGPLPDYVVPEEMRENARYPDAQQWTEAGPSPDYVVPDEMKQHGWSHYPYVQQPPKSSSKE